MKFRCLKDLTTIINEIGVCACVILSVNSYFAKDLLDAIYYMICAILVAVLLRHH